MAQCMSMAVADAASSSHAAATSAFGNTSAAWTAVVTYGPGSGSGGGADVPQRQRLASEKCVGDRGVAVGGSRTLGAARAVVERRTFGAPVLGVASTPGLAGGGGRHFGFIRAARPSPPHDAPRATAPPRRGCCSSRLPSRRRPPRAEPLPGPVSTLMLETGWLAGRFLSRD